MKTLQKTNARNSERGSVAIMIALMWTTLFGMAVVAVDFGYLYTKRRNVQAAADAAVSAGMPVLALGNQNGATSRAQSVANQNNFSGGDIVTNTATATQLTVTLQHTYPTFFAGVMGMAPKTIKATSIGQISTIAGPAIHANDSVPACAGQWAQNGIEVTGNGFLKVNGSIESMNKIHVGTINAGCNPGSTCMVTGTVKSSCPLADIFNDDPTRFGMPVPTPNAALTDPLAGHDLAWFQPKCTNGTSTLAPFNPVSVPWINGPCLGGSSLPPNTVICASDNITIAPPFGMSICASTAAFIAGGTLGIMGDGAITLTGPASTDGIIGYSAFAGGGPAIQLANGAILGNYTLTGHIYAPFGLINAGTGTPGFTMTGILDGGVVFIAMGAGQPWTFNGPSGGTSSWHFYR